MRLWLLRHAPVDLPPGTCYGATDVPADDDLTRAAASRWAKRLPRGARIRVSALRRATALAAALVERRPDLATPIVDARLSEMDFGDWELRRWDELPPAAFDGWLADFAHHRVGGGESTQSVIDRVGEALAEERALGGSPVWVTHAGVIRAATYLARGGATPIRSADDWPVEAPAPGEGLELEVRSPSTGG